MSVTRPQCLEPARWLGLSAVATEAQVVAAMHTDKPGVRELAVLLSPAGDGLLETMARRARAITARRFGKVVSLYAPLYLSNHCSGGCVYCGFASDVPIRRRKIEKDELQCELRALNDMGFEEVLLLTGERSAEVGFQYVRDCVATAATIFHNVTIETFPMNRDEYHQLAQGGCTGVTVYQETYDPAAYEQLHRWGPKRDYGYRLETAARALEGDLRTVGMGVLLGLSEPVGDLISLFRHIALIQKRFWKAGVSVSFPRVRPQRRGYAVPRPVSDRFLLQAICAFRICLPDVPLVLSTREGPGFRDGVAGIGISKMSAASKTTVGGYASGSDPADGQFEVFDGRDVAAFSEALRKNGLSPVLKDWDMTYSTGVQGHATLDRHATSFLVNNPRSHAE